MVRRLLPFIIIIVVIAAAFLFYVKYKDKPVSTNPADANSVTVFVNDTNTVKWTSPLPVKEQTMYGELPGQEITAQTMRDSANVASFENKTTLQQEGFKLDNNLAAAGAGSSITGYKKTVDGKNQIVFYSYQTEPTSTNPNEPLQFDCPCKVNLKVFVSDPFDAK